MANKKVATMTMIASSVGFILGLAIGKATRDALPSNVEVTTEGSTIIIKAKAGQALRQGIANVFEGLL